MLSLCSKLKVAFAFLREPRVNEGVIVNVNVDILVDKMQFGIALRMTGTWMNMKSARG